MGVAVHSSHIVSATPSSSEGALLTLFPCFSMKSLSRHTSAQVWGLPDSPGCRSRSAPLWTYMDCRQTACLTMVFITGCKVKISALAPGASPLPLSSLILVSARLFLSHILTPLSRLLVHSRFFSLLNVLSQGCYHCHWLAWPWPAEGLSEPVRRS